MKKNTPYYVSRACLKPYTDLISASFFFYSFAIETGKCGNNCSPSCPHPDTGSSSVTDGNVDFFFFAVTAGGTGKCGCNEFSGEA
jgi:hypothetical protein